MVRTARHRNETDPQQDGADDAPTSRMRADKWLYFARFCRTRSLAAALIGAGQLRINSQKTVKPAHAVGTDDVLTFPQGNSIRVIRILTLPTRRGPATETQATYADLSPAAEDSPPSPRYDGKGRPTAKDRRNALLSRRRPLD